MCGMRRPLASRAYAASLSHLGTPFEVPEWGTWILRRETLEGGAFDWAGCYPLTTFGPHADIPAGLRRVKSAGGVSITIVSNSMAELDELANVARPFKRHYIHDNRQGPPHYSKHHRYEVRRAVRDIETRIIQLDDHLSAWMELYGALVESQKIDPRYIFPEAAFRALANIDGLVTFGAFSNDELVSCHLWMSDEETAYSLFAASDAEGYHLRASYAIYDAAIQYFSNVHVINFGGAAGVTDNPKSGLVRFKRGFSNAETQSNLYGIVLDQEKYDEMSGATRTEYFPAYRNHTRYSTRRKMRQ
jgi:hypothetical protein